MFPAGTGSAILLWVLILGAVGWYLNRPGTSAEDQGLKLWGFGLIALIVLGTAAALYSWLVSPI